MDASNPEVELRQHKSKIAGRLAVPAFPVGTPAVLARSWVRSEVSRLGAALGLLAVAVAKLTALSPPRDFMIEDVLGVV